MLVNQGVIGIKHWTGVDPDPTVMRAALEEAFSDSELNPQCSANESPPSTPSNPFSHHAELNSNQKFLLLLLRTPNLCFYYYDFQL